jgi:radical SAM protein with 4Fe4S-binding SPASM domain
MRPKELPAEKFISIIDEITDAGCLFLLLTGGDPLLRKDFSSIYRQSKKKGLLVTVFTNGSLITDAVTGLFADLPPQAVEISLYGSTPSTFEKITRTPGSFSSCIRGIERLLEKNIRVRLKTVLMSLNSHEFFEMRSMAEKFGVPFRFDPAISPCLNGDRSPLKFRVSPREAVEKEFSDEKRQGAWLDYLHRFSGSPITNRLYNCGAGINNFHVDPYGNLRPCLMATTPKHDLFHSSFMDGWKNTIPLIHNIKVSDDYLCNKCDKRDICGFCAPFFEMENGNEIYSEYHCALSKYRYRTIYSGKFDEEEYE